MNPDTYLPKVPNLPQFGGQNMQLPPGGMPANTPGAPQLDPAPATPDGTADKPVVLDSDISKATEQYHALPPGTHFKDRNGNIRVKK